MISRVWAGHTGGAWENSEGGRVVDVGCENISKKKCGAPGKKLETPM